MITLGTFRKDGENYVGTINTLAFSGPVAIETATEKKSPDSPDHRVLGGRGRVDMGAAWKERSEKGSDYLSVRIDEPSFPGPINARLVQFDGEEVYRLIWSRN
jgi:uncharacterized protein (DUF736 family)